MGVSEAGWSLRSLKATASIPSSDNGPERGGTRPTELLHSGGGPSQVVPFWPRLPWEPELGSDAQSCQGPRARDLPEAVGSTHPDEIFL